MAATAQNRRPYRPSHEIDWENPDPDDLVAFVETHARAGRYRRARWEAHAARQLAWVQGDQFTLWRADLDRLAELDWGEVFEDVPIQHRHPVQMNDLRSPVMQRVAMLLGGGLNFLVRPATSDDDDIAAARLGTKLLRYVLAHGPMPAKRRLIWAVWHMVVTGIIWVKPCWNPDLGERQRFGPDVDDQDDDEARAKKRESFSDYVAKGLGRDPANLRFEEDGSVWMPPGDVEWEFPTGFDVTEPDMAREAHEADWVIISRWRSMEYMHHKYGAAETEHLQPDIYGEEHIHDWVALYGEYAADSDSRIRDAAYDLIPHEMVLEHQLWRPGRPWLPNGAYAVVAQGEALHVGPHPYEHRELPLCSMTEMPSHRFRPAAAVGMALSMQEARNRNISSLQTIVNQHVCQKMLQEQGAGIPEDAFSQRPSVITCKSIDGIKPLEYPRIPGEILALDETYRRGIMSVLGVHDSTLGRGESAQQSGRHAAILRQGDQMTNSVTRQIMAVGLAQAGMQTLSLYEQFVKNDRMVRIAGKAHETEVISFKGSDLLGRRQNDAPGVTVYDVQAMIVEDADETLQIVAALTQLGYLDPQNETHRAQVMRMIGDQIPAHERDRETEARELAAVENRRLVRERKLELPPNLGDLDELHIEEHRRYTTTSEYRTAARRDATLADRMQKHILAHLYAAAEKRVRVAMIEQQVTQRLQQEIAAEATPADPGAPAGPGGPDAMGPGGPMGGDPLEAAMATIQSLGPDQKLALAEAIQQSVGGGMAGTNGNGAMMGPEAAEAGMPGGRMF